MPFISCGGINTSQLSSMAQVHRKFEESSKRINHRCQQIKEKVAALMAVDSQRPAVLLRELDRLGLVSLTGNVASVPENKSLFPCDNIPFTPNPHFLERQEELNNIPSHFGDLLTSKTFCSFVLYGTGGIGKTQTALSYAHEQVTHGISAVQWLNCETGLSVAQSFYEVADMLQLEVRNAWPVASHGAVLVTSRDSIVSIDPAAAGMEIRVFRDESGADLLTNLIRRAEYSEEGRHSACLLSARLGGLPLAFAAMASQIRLRGRSITDFLGLYEKHSRQLNEEKERD
ncbi:hypothetical protein EAF00_001946 [Botryotinia globosa]|nr:hypothetical protein EAF00_001946 [Botryotinia globosa]